MMTMNDLGLYSGLSDALRRWADLVDKVLTGIKGGNVLSNKSAFEEFRHLINGIAQNDESKVDFSDQRISNILALELGKRLSWQELAEQLNNPEHLHKSISTLEAIAQCLSIEHASTMKKMRWGRP
jgi:hypothetical protein